MAYFKRYIALPQDHGSWVFILSPLAIGLIAGKTITIDSLALICCAMAAFLVRQPITIATKVYTGRRPRTELSSAYFWILVYSFIILLSVSKLLYSGLGMVLLLIIPAAPVFGWHLYLVSKRSERHQAGVEILATGILALAAPAAFWVGLGHYNSQGWLFWLLIWLQSAASIVYVYLRLEQRGLAENSTKLLHWQLGRKALIYTSFNLFLSIGLGILGITSPFIFIPYLLQWSETLWGISHPAIGEKPTRIGIRQLIISILFTILFIIFWSV